MNKRSIRRKKKRKEKKARAREFLKAEREKDYKTLARLKSQMSQEEIELTRRVRNNSK